MEYGKFNSAEELLKGYESLEKSFTQKCQQLAALEKQINASGTNESSSPQDGQGQSVANDRISTVPDAASADSLPSANQASAQTSLDDIRQYLAEHPEVSVELLGSADSLSDNNERTTPPRVMTSGGNVSCALPNRPTTLKEASELAKKYFK